MIASRDPLSASGGRIPSRSQMAIARPTEPYPDQSWSGWGDPALTPQLSDSVRALVEQGLGVRRPGRPAGAISDVELPPPRLRANVAAELSRGRRRRARTAPTTRRASVTPAASR